MIWGGKPAEIVKAAEEGKVWVFISEDILAEINQVLAYPKIEKVYTPELTRQQLIEQVLKTAKFVKVTKKVKVVREHAADDKFLECALAANADYIVSGDKHVLKVAVYKKTKILSVADFVDSIL